MQYCVLSYSFNNTHFVCNDYTFVLYSDMTPDKLYFYFYVNIYSGTQIKLSTA